jgi:hypothetical protein
LITTILSNNLAQALHCAEELHPVPPYPLEKQNVIPIVSQIQRLPESECLGNTSCSSPAAKTVMTENYLSRNTLHFGTQFKAALNCFIPFGSFQSSRFTPSCNFTGFWNSITIQIIFKLMAYKPNTSSTTSKHWGG